MAQLSCFSDEDVRDIVSLPYRVGLHVSYADDEDGESDDEREMLALEVCLQEVIKLHENSDFIKEVASETLRLKSEWGSWAQGVFNIEPVCESVILALKSKISDEDVKLYIKMVLEIASSVAQAYGEFGEEIEPEKGFLGKAMGRIVKGFANMSDDDSHPMNISASEESSISSIAAALKKNL